MRVFIGAIALVLVIGAVMPTEADARAARKVEKWGCTFKAHLVLDTGAPPNWPWGGAGDIDCDTKQTLIVRMAVLQDTPGVPNRLVRRDTWVLQEGPGGKQEGLSAMIGGGVCSQAGPPAYPYYFRMNVKRKAKPGAAWIASHNSNPCPRGSWPAD